MSNALVKAGSSPFDSIESLLQWCFSTKPIVDNWSAVLAFASAGALDENQIARELTLKGPKLANEPLEDQVKCWGLQQKLRLAIRARKGLPLVTNFKCSRCAKNNTDPVLFVCMECAAKEEQISQFGSRGGCEYIRPAFDPAKDEWSILVYKSFLTSDARAPFMFYAATGFGSYSEAEDNILPLSNYARLLMTRSSGYYDTADIINFIALVDQRLPLGPTAWREFVRDQIVAHAANHTQERDLDNILSSKLEDLARKEQRAPAGDDD